MFGFFTNFFKNNFDIFWYAAGRRSCSALPTPMFKKSKFFRPQNLRGGWQRFSNTESFAPLKLDNQEAHFSSDSNLP